MSEKKFNVDIAIVGGGASGLAAAVSAGKKAFSSGRKCRIVIIEKEKRTGKKLLATGNGRCNLTNKNMSEEFYNGSCRELIGDTVKKYGTDRIIAFFNSLGVVCKTDTQGRVYPNSEQASAVLDMLRINAARYGAEEMCGCCVERITPSGNGFLIKTEDMLINAEKVILTTGGKAQQKLGSDGSTYRLARMLGLKCSPIFPSLVPIKVKSDDMPFLKGIRTAAAVSLIADGKTVNNECGELQLTQIGLSGICVFQLSRFVNEFFASETVKGETVKSISVSVDLMPNFTLDEVERMLFRRRKQLAFLTLEEFFTGLLNKKIGQCLLKKLKLLPLSRTSDTLGERDVRSLARLIKDWRFQPSAMSDMDSAQVTAGGVVASEINSKMQSVKYKNLYIAGEALDADGLCGGYNLHWAFASGIIAGKEAVMGED